MFTNCVICGIELKEIPYAKYSRISGKCYRCDGNDGQCLAITKKNRRCLNAGNYDGYCLAHYREKNFQENKKLEYIKSHEKKLRKIEHEKELLAKRKVIYDKHISDGYCGHLDTSMMWSQKLCYQLIVKDNLCHKHYIQKFHPDHGYIYLFSLGYMNLYKLGKAVNWENRLLNFKISSPFIKMVNVVLVPDRHKLEMTINWGLGRFRFDGMNEIFCIPDNDLCDAINFMNKHKIVI